MLNPDDLRIGRVLFRSQSGKHYRIVRGEWINDQAVYWIQAYHPTTGETGRIFKLDNRNNYYLARTWPQFDGKK